MLRKEGEAYCNITVVLQATAVNTMLNNLAEPSYGDEVHPGRTAVPHCHTALAC